ncbi:MAG: TonB family protein [Acidobacteria bacterium]|nr:TonB family protein [Acidobacteriota bacterium]
MADENKTPTPERTDDTLDSLALQASISDEGGSEMKVAWLAAIIFHFALFVVVFPEFGSTDTFEETKETVVIKRYKPPEPPKEQPKKKVVKKKTARVPIPDPTPDDPEPIVEEDVEYIEMEEEVADTDFMMGGPVGGPPVIDTGPMRVGGDITAPERIHYVAPEYPELARRARLGGIVILQATIDREGAVTNVELLRGLGLGLDEAAITAVTQWMYTPTFYNGRPVEILLTVTVQFQLQ